MVKTAKKIAAPFDLDDGMLLFEILPQKQFSLPFTVEVVRMACVETGKKFTSKRVAQILEYLVTIQKLKSRKERITKKDGTLGIRLINVYSKIK